MEAAGHCQKTRQRVSTEPGRDTAETEASHNAMWDLPSGMDGERREMKQVASLQKEGKGWQ